jgi:hypothetical protein
MTISSMDLYHNQQGTSNKFYLGILFDDGNYLTAHGGVQGSVTLNFHNKSKKVYNNFLDSIKTANYDYYYDKRREKEKKGYSKVSTLDFNKIKNNPSSNDYRELYKLINKSKFDPTVIELNKILNSVDSSLNSDSNAIDEEIEKQKVINKNRTDKKDLKEQKDKEEKKLLTIEKSRNNIINEDISFY